MTAKLIIDRTERSENEMDISFRLADGIDVSDQEVEDLIAQHAHKEYPNRMIQVQVSEIQDRKGYARVTAFAE